MLTCMCDKTSVYCTCAVSSCIEKSVDWYPVQLKKLSGGVFVFHIVFFSHGFCLLLPGTQRCNPPVALTNPYHYAALGP